ncbi:MAG: CHAT domain-containing protein, partial [Patiriisocius sp.]
FMEKNKALLLASEIEKQQNKQSAAFPKEVLEQELLLKKKVITLEKEQKKKLKDVTISQEILLVKQRIKLFQDSIKVIFPNYVIAKKTSIISIGDIQKRLKDYEVNIQFHISEDDEYGVYSNADNGYILITTPTKVVFEEIKNLQKLKENTTKLSKTLKVPFKSEADIEAYTEISLAIYNQLFISEEIKTLLHSKKAIIIPDNYISFIPFEALMTSNEPNSYLIKQTEISYSYSNSFQVNSSKSKIRESKILGMAPIDFKPLHLPKLVYSEHEINNIKKYFKGDFYTGTTATKQQFLDASTTHNILHLATHADARDGTSPWIAFSDTKLELEDLYVTSNDASLVFLSGCNTTLGEQATGEGVMSLARGFFYAGSQSVISTLWRIDDKSTAEIAGYFYQNISEGQTKSKALHRAKLRYLDKHSLSDISPHYWASYILLGENNSINTSSSLFLKISIISCLLLLFAIFIQRNKKVKNSF